MVKPIYREMKAQMMKGAYVQVDETPIRYLEPGNGKTALGYLWVAHQPRGDVVFEWYTTREAKHILHPDGAADAERCGRAVHNRCG